MKRLSLCACLLSFSLIFSSLFSNTNVYASMRSLRDYQTIQSIEYVQNNWRDSWESETYPYINNYDNGTAYKSYNYLDQGGDAIGGNQFRTIHSHQIVDDNSPRLLVANRDYNVSISGFTNRVLFKVYETGQVGYAYGSLFCLQYKLYYTDGSESGLYYYDDRGYTYNNSNNTYSVNLSITPDKDVSKVRLYVTFMYPDYSNKFYSKGHIYHEVYYGINTATSSSIKLSVAETTEELGWLEKIWTSVGNWFQDLGESIGGFFRNITNNLSNWFQDISEWQSDITGNLGTWFSNLFDSIVALPEQIWTKVSNGLQWLFVPDDEDWDRITDSNVKDISERFGFLGQIGTMLVERYNSFTAFTVSDEVTVNIPEVTISLPGDNEFTFGGYDVDVVPDGFGFLADSSKTITSLVCTALFINTMYRRYTSIFSGH